MKKILFLIFLSAALSSPLFAAEDGYSTQGPLGRMGAVMGRGVGNMVGLPFEIPRTLQQETEMHSRMWPLTFAPRLFTNIFTRGTSAANDIFFFPWAAPWMRDLSPLTKPMGLPEYPWEFQ